ncbi:MAG TPA: urea ABC transporter permease subunit UrtB [Vicinamibacterales bacterium]
MSGRRGRQHAWVLLAVVILSAPVWAAQTAPTDDAMLAALRDASLADKAAIIQQLADSGRPWARTVLAALLDDRLFARQRNGRVFILPSSDENTTTVELIDPLTGHPQGTASRDEIVKIGTNNQLRKRLRVALARFDLNSPDRDTRLASAQELLRSLDDEGIALLKARRAVEHDRRVRGEIDVGLALAALSSPDAQTRLDAVHTLAGQLRPEARNALAALVDRAPDGSVAEPDGRVRAAAADAIRGIDRRRAFYASVQTLFFGLSVGAVLVLVAIGLAITFGLMGVINMAHGEFMMLGAYTTYLVQLAMPQHIGASVLVAIPAAFVVAGIAGVILERTVIRFLYGRPLETLLATFGVSLILQQLVRSLFSANNRAVETPQWMSGTVAVNEALALTANRLYVIGFTLVVFAALQIILKRTRAGLYIRAVSQNRGMAAAMGVRTSWVDAMTFGLGSGIAGMAGVALSQLTNVGPNLGQSYIIDAFMVVVFGGVGNLWGTLAGGMAMGIVNQLLEPYSGAVLAKIFVLVALILFIQRWPRGVFPLSGRAAESS